jgi:hypothetical protein
VPHISGVFGLYFRQLFGQNKYDRCGDKLEEISMLKPIPTVHPVIMFGSLAILGGLIYWNLHSGLQGPGWWVSLPAIIVISVACTTSLRKRTKAINDRYSKR